MRQHVIRVSLTALLFAVVTLSAAGVRAQSTVPPVAKDFLTYCAKNAAACDAYMRDVEFALLANTAVTGGHYCGPDSYTADVGKKVRAQVAKAPAKTLGGPTDDALRSALTALYPCKPGVRSVADFLKKCDNAPSQCSDDIDNVSLVLQMNEDKSFCPPDPDKVSTDEIIANWATIKAWLKAHPNGPNVSRAMADAWRARYPCKR